MADRHNRDLDRKPGPLPQALKTKTVDSHAHLELIHNSEPDSPLIKQTLAEAAAVGIDRVVQVGYSAEQSIWSVKCAESFIGQVVAAVALHPNEAPVVEDLEKDLHVIDELAANPRVRAISSGHPIFKPCRCSIALRKLDASLSESTVPVSNHVVPRPNLTQLSSLLAKYCKLTSVISNSPRGLGTKFLAISITELG